MHVLVGEAWADRYATWRHEVEGKVGAGQDVTLELEEGALILDDLAARLTGEDAERVARAADAVRRTSCSLDVRPNAALDEAVGELVAPIPDARLSESTRPRVWVHRRRAPVGARSGLFPPPLGPEARAGGEEGC